MDTVSSCMKESMRLTVDLYEGHLSIYEISLMEQSLYSLMRLMCNHTGKVSSKAKRKLIAFFVEANVAVLQFDLNQTPFEQVVSHIVFVFGGKAFVPCKRIHYFMPQIDEEDNC